MTKEELINELQNYQMYLGEFVSDFVINALMSLLWTGVAVLTIGIVFLITSIVINAVKRYKAKNIA